MTVVIASITVAGGTASATTIDRMDTDWSDYYRPSALPQPYFIVLGSAARYHLSDASSLGSDAGSFRPGWAFLSDVSVDNGVASYLFESAFYPSLFQHTDYDGGDHSAQGELAVFTPFVLIAAIGDCSGIIRGYTEILSNDETCYGESRFNYYSAVVGDRVSCEQTVQLYNEVFSEDLLNTEFGYRISEFVDFTRIYTTPEPGTLALLGLELVGVGVMRRQRSLPNRQRISPRKPTRTVARRPGSTPLLSRSPTCAGIE